MGPAPLIDTLAADHTLTSNLAKRKYATNQLHPLHRLAHAQHLPRTPNELKRAIQLFQKTKNEKHTLSEQTIASPIRDRIRRSLTAIHSPSFPLTRKWYAIFERITVARENSKVPQSFDPTPLRLQATTLDSPPSRRNLDHPPKLIVTDSTDSELLEENLEYTQWVLVVRISLGLLDWWLNSLLDLSFKAYSSRDFWLRQQRRPVRHYLWRGPRHWYSSGIFGQGACSDDVPTPAAALELLHEVQKAHAGHIGRLRECLFQLKRACNSDQHVMKGACFNSLAEIRRTVAAYIVDSTLVESLEKRDAADDILQACYVLGELISKSEIAIVRAEGRFRGASLPSHIRRHWMAYSCVVLGGGTCLGLSYRRSDQVVTLLRTTFRGALEATRDFWREHVYAPVATMVQELVYRQHLQHSDPRAIEDADTLLNRLLVQFRETWKAELDAIQLRDSDDDMARLLDKSRAEEDGYGNIDEASQSHESIPTGRLRRFITTTEIEEEDSELSLDSEGTFLENLESEDTDSTTLVEATLSKSDMLSAMSRLLEQQMASPAYNMARGPLLQLLLIQTQYMRCELLQQMAAMDTVLRQNQLTASMSALLPGAIGVAIVLTATRRLWRRLRSRRRSRLSLMKQIRSILLDIERLLMRSRASGSKHLLQIDLGSLVIGLHALRRAIHRHRVLLTCGERQSLQQDLADIEEDTFDVAAKLDIVERIYRTQPALLGSTSASGVTRPPELGSLVISDE